MKTSVALLLTLTCMAFQFSNACTNGIHATLRQGPGSGRRVRCHGFQRVHARGQEAGVDGL